MTCRLRRRKKKQRGVNLEGGRKREGKWSYSKAWGRARQGWRHVFGFCCSSYSQAKILQLLSQAMPPMPTTGFWGGWTKLERERASGSVGVPVSTWQWEDNIKTCKWKTGLPAGMYHILDIFNPLKGSLEVSSQLRSNVGTCKQKTGSPTRVCHNVDTSNPL